MKRSIHAGFFEIRLFSDDVLTLLRTQLEMLRHSLTYLRLSLVPALWVILPLAIIVSHLEFHFGYDGLVPGQPALVKATLRSGARPEGPPLTLEAPSAMRIDTPAVWLPAAREVVWRVTPVGEGDHLLQVHLGDQVSRKRCASRLQLAADRQSGWTVACGIGSSIRLKTHFQETAS